MTTKRDEFSKRTKVKAFERSGGKCECCGKRLTTGDIEYDHIIPCALGGDNSLENCQVICRKSCHRSKTKKDVNNISKAKRVEAYHYNTKGRSNCPLPFGRNSKLKRKINGQIVPRDQS